MHTINLSDKNIRTDLILEQNNTLKYNSKEEIYNDIKVIESSDEEYNYTTIYFKDITDKDNFKSVEKVLIDKLHKYLKLKEEDTILVIGLGNDKSTPDSLGPKTINNILVTRYLFLLGEVEKGYSNVCTFIPNVMGNTGIETSNIITSIINETNASKVVIIDSLKTNSIKRLNKTIQITNSGIKPGSGIGNTRKEISKKTTNKEIIAIGVPTVINMKSTIEEKEELIVTPTNIDYLIDKLSLLLGNSLNKTLHKNFIRQNNN